MYVSLKGASTVSWDGVFGLRPPTIECFGAKYTLFFNIFIRERSGVLF